MLIIDLKMFFLAIAGCVPALVTVALLTIAERKILAGLQRRQGPSVVGAWGFLQVIADGFKLLLKSSKTMCSKRNKVLFIVCPIFSFVLSFSMWAVVPYTSSHIISYLNYGLLWLLILSSLKVYTIFFSGWSSNSKYPLLGGLRAVAQVISYEIALGFCFLCVSILSGTLNLTEIVLAQRGVFFFLPLLPVAILFFLVVLAETNRPPFDMAEAESELVAGYNLEYSAVYFAFLFLGEYCSILVMSALWVILFFGGWLPIINIFSFVPEIIWMLSKTLLVCFLMVISRGIMPRYRYDQLMSLGWKVFFISSFAFLIFLISICYCFNFNSRRVAYTNNGTFSANNTSKQIPFFNRRFKKIISRKNLNFYIKKKAIDKYVISNIPQITTNPEYFELRSNKECGGTLRIDHDDSMKPLFPNNSLSFFYVGNQDFWTATYARKPFTAPLKCIIKYNKTPPFGLNGELSVNLFPVARPPEYVSTPQPMSLDLSKMTSLQGTEFSVSDDD